PGDPAGVGSAAERDGSQPTRPRFSRHVVIGERFKTVAFLGRGPVGEVYEVDDAELGTRVALKLVHPEIASDERSARCITRSIVLTRGLVSRHICPIHDLGRHRTAGGDALFLTMPLLAGESLYDRLQREGRQTMAVARS